MEQQQTGSSASDPPRKDWNFERIRSLLSEEASTLAQHRDAMRQEPHLYTAVITSLLELIELSSGTKTRALTAAYENVHTRALGHYLLYHKQFTLPEILRAIKLLDSRRNIRSVEKKLQRMKVQGSASARTLGNMQAKLNDLKREESVGSLSGALVRNIKGWVRSISAETLEFYALTFPKDPWKELADLLHLRPDDFQLTWFLDYVFDAAPAPSESIVSIGNLITDQNVCEMVEKHPVPYRFLRKKINTRALREATRATIAEYTDINTLIWYYEELCAPKVNDVISAKLAKGQEPDFGYGKLMERLMFFMKSGVPFYAKLIPVAEKRLKQYNIPLEPPVSVAGDASASMQVAIETATIISSLLTALIQANLLFFNQNAVRPPIVPKTIDDVINVATFMRASGATSPAAALGMWLEQKKENKFLIFVTDEEENLPYNGMFFSDVLKRYLEEVSPSARVVFMSFIEGSDEGMMVTDLRKKLGIDCMQFKLSKQRPDLTKVDQFLGALSAHGTHFKDEIEALERLLASHESAGQAEKIQLLSSLAKKQRQAGRYYFLYVWGQLLVRVLSSEWSIEWSERKKRIDQVLQRVTEISKKSQLAELTEELAAWAERLRQVVSEGDFVSGTITTLRQELTQSIENLWESKYTPLIDKAFKRGEAELTAEQLLQQNQLLAANQEQTSVFYNLSAEMILYVFSYLDLQDLQTCQCVSQLFKRLATDKSLWHKYGSRGGAPKMLDLVFCVDNTASMGTYIAETQTKIVEIVEKISNLGSQGCDVVFGLVAYRDHPPQDMSFVTKVFQFTSSLKEMKKNVGTMQAQGGGDGPEAVACAMYEVLHLPYRRGSTKICIFIADAPPHGLEVSDGFPDGCPMGRDPIQIARQLIQKGIVVYSVACEPAIGGFRYGRDFMKAIADITEGQCVALSNARLLADVITGGAEEQLELNELKEKVEKELDKLPPEIETEQEIIFHVTLTLQEQGIKTARLKVDTIDAKQAPFSYELMRCSSLAEGKNTLVAIRAKGSEDPRNAVASRVSGQPATGSVDLQHELVSADQVKRVYRKILAEKRGKK